MNNKKKTKVTIRRKKWLRGGTGNASMRNKNDSQCCLGFVARACGIAVKDILLKGTPDEVVKKILSSGGTVPDSFMPLVIIDERGADNSEIAEKLMDTNDDVDLTPSEREKKIKENLSNIGFDVTFTD